MELPKKAKELKIGLYLNYIDRKLPSEISRKIMLMFACMTKVMGEEYHTRYKKLYPKLMYEDLGNASRKEIAATTVLCFSANQARKLLGVSTSTYKQNYESTIKDDFDLADQIVSMQPIVPDFEDTVMEDMLIKFLEQFRVATKHNSKTIVNDFPRTLEIDFLFIYRKLVEIFNNDIIAREFVQQFCYLTEIESTCLMNMISNIYKLDRRYPALIGAHSFFISEVYNIYSLRGYSKSYIGEKVLGYSRGYFLAGSYKRFAKTPTEQDLIYQKDTILQYPPIGLRTIKEFVDLFHDFVDCLNEISI